MKESDSNESNSTSFIEVEARLLEQEHRPPHLVLNFLNRKKKWPNPNDPRRKAAQKAIVWRLFFSPAVLAVGGSTILGLVTAFILFKQTDILNEQTRIIDEQKVLLQEQNRKIEIQANLEEANRRNNLVFLMDNILNQVGEELRAESNTDSVLSKPLVARIRALCQGFQPYKFLDYSLKSTRQNDSLGLTNELSPERGQLFLALINSGIGKRTLDNIFIDSNFDFAYIRNFESTGVKLRNVSLRNSNLYQSGFSKSKIETSFFNNSVMDKTRFPSTQLNLVTFNHASLEGASFYDAYLIRVYFDQSNCNRADFGASKLFHTKFDYANLIEANFYKAELFDVTFEGANLEKANFIDAKLNDISFEHVKSLDSALVDKPHWISWIRDTLMLDGSQRIKDLYKVVYLKNIPRRTNYHKKNSYVLVRKVNN